MSSKLTYRPDIDGLRAIAVIAVVLYHAGLGCPGGYTGVDIFFVISGFLITSIILRDLEVGNFSPIEFCERRVRRILPALAVCVFATLIVGWLLLLPSDLESLAESTLAQCAFSANIYFWRTTDYFGASNLEKPLLHTWSLAVEEQFYLLFPLCLLAVYRVRRGRSNLGLHILIFGGFSSSLALAIWGVTNQPFATFFLLPTRAWELLCGSTLAALPVARLSRSTAEGISWIGLACIAIPIFWYSEQTPFPGLAAFPSCLGTMTIIWANHKLPDKAVRSATSVSAALSTAPLRFIGVISYSLYLWHWPILVYADYWKIGNFGIAIKSLLVAVAIGAATASWRWIETPFRRREYFASRRAIFTLASFFTILTLSVAWVIDHGKGMPDRLSEHARAILRELDASKSTSRRWPAQTGITDIRRNAVPVIGSSEIEKIHFLVLGDSHASMTLPVFDEIAGDLELRGSSITHNATVPLVKWTFRFEHSATESAALWEEAIRYMERHDIREVFLVAFWSTYERYGNCGELISGLEHMIEHLESSGARVWIVLDVPTYDRNVQEWCFVKRCSQASLLSLPGGHRLNTKNLTAQYTA